MEYDVSLPRVLEVAIGLYRDADAVAYRGGVWGVQPPPPKF